MAIHSISSTGSGGGGGDNLTIYTASASAPAAPAATTYPGANQWTVPTGWSRSPPVSVLQLWATTGVLNAAATSISWPTPTQYASPSAGVTSVTAGGNSLQGNISFVAGTNTTVTSSGQNITINNTGVSGVGVSGQPQITGAVTLAAGANTTLTQSGSTITVASSGGGGGGITLSTTGQSGPATIVSGTALTIPQYVRNPFADSNSASGISAMASITSGIYNTATGAYALNATTVGQYNTAHGNAALQANTSGNFNTAVGALALSLSTNSTFNAAYGYNSMKLNTTGSSNTAIGSGALYNNTTSSNSTALGRWSGDNQPSRVVLSDGAENITFYAKTPIGGGDQTKYVLLNGRTAQGSGGGVEISGNLVFQPATVAPTLGVNLDAALWMNGTVPTMSVRNSSGVTTAYPLGLGADYVRTTAYAYNVSGITISNTTGPVFLGGNGNNQVATVGSVAIYNPPIDTQLSVAGIDAGRLPNLGLYYTATAGSGGTGTIRIAESLIEGGSQTLTASVIFGSVSYQLAAVDNDGTYLWALGHNGSNYLVVRVTLGASSQATVTYLRSNTFTVNDGGGSFLNTIYAFDVQPNGTANQYRFVFSGSSITPSSQNIVYSTIITTTASAITVSSGLTPSSAGLGNGVLTLPVFLLFAPNATTTYACVGGGGHVYRYTTASGTWTQIYYNSVTGNQPQSGFFDSTNNRLAFNMENGITISLDTQSLSYQQYAAIPGYNFGTAGVWGLWDDLGILNFLINMTPSGGLQSNFWVTAGQKGAVQVNGDVVVSGSVKLGTTVNPSGSVYATDGSGTTAFATPTVTGQTLLSNLAGEPYWGYAAASGIAAFALTESVTTNGAGIFVVGSVKSGTVTQLINNIGVIPPTAGNSAFTVPAGLYLVTFNASFAGTLAGGVTVIANVGTNGQVSGVGNATTLLVSNSKIQSGSDTIACSGTMVMNLNTATNFNVTYFFGNSAGSSTARISSDGNCQLILQRIS